MHAGSPAPGFTHIRVTDMAAKQKRKKKSKTGKAPELKSRAQMTESECLRIVEEGRKLLRAYLEDVAGENMSEHGRKCLFRVIEDEYRYRMDTDALYFDSVNRFLFERKAGEDAVKDSVFLYGLVQDTEREGRIKETLAARFPEVYRLPDEERRPFSRIFGLGANR